MDLVQSLQQVERKYRKGTLDFEELNIEAMAYDCRIEILKLRSENEALKKEIEALRQFKTCFDGLYQKGIGLCELYITGDLNPFDELYEKALMYAGLD